MSSRLAIHANAAAGGGGGGGGVVGRLYAHSYAYVRFSHNLAEIHPQTFKWRLSLWKIIWLEMEAVVCY